MTVLHGTPVHESGSSRASPFFSASQFEPLLHPISQYQSRATKRGARRTRVKAHRTVSPSPRLRASTNLKAPLSIDQALYPPMVDTYAFSFWMDFWNAVALAEWTPPFPLRSRDFMPVHIPCMILEHNVEFYKLPFIQCIAVRTSAPSDFPRTFRVPSLVARNLFAHLGQEVSLSRNCTGSVIVWPSRSHAFMAVLSGTPVHESGSW
ncbi:hypothetical protein GALMADRAFT_142198 [Galerina marginata CBS 339.88]|uniref:Uncharacterized protein n=1 Tax=Galerina marginata (strain CBS 339.88) TaxID=685588 RepID=A0A067SS85_GALM3|nr:hypothetical protein GALMADRAFT_142198 [Galerina marginata CBS 339.88]